MTYYIVMEYKIVINVDEDIFPNDNPQEISEGTQTIKKISLQDPEEENLGRMEEYFEYLKICDKQLESSTKETNLSSSQ